MATTLGIKMIEMYEEMIRNDFDPLVKRLEARTTGIKPKLTKLVKKEMGVYDLYAEKAALEARLKEITSELYDVEKKQYRIKLGKYMTPIEEAVEDKVLAFNEPLIEVMTVRDQLIRDLKLAGVGAEVKTSFEALPGVIEDLFKRFGSLPEITDEEMGLLPEPDDNGS